MAVIYADMVRIQEFRDRWEAVPPQMEASVADRDDYVSAARMALEKGLEEAERICNAARIALDHARDALEKASKTEDGPSDSLRRAVERCERAYEFARRQQEELEEHRDRFQEESLREMAEQDRTLESCKSLGKKGSQWVDGYVQKLTDAKRAIFEDAPSGTGSFQTPDGGYVGARDLTDGERAELAARTGWSEKAWNKCQLRPDGSLWFKTNNSAQDMHFYNGVMFQRDTVMINGVRVEGVFPKFDVTYQPDVLMPEELWKGCGKNNNAQFAWCRSQLKTAVESNPALAAQFTKEERKLIAAEKELPNYTWHHNQQPGKMQLVPSKKHSAGMHGVNHTGGYALWCTVFPEE